MTDETIGSTASFGPDLVTLRTIQDIMAELRYARKKFPTSLYKLAALVEEVGELSQALIDHSFGKQTAEQVYKEAIQVASTAIRVAEEGSKEFPYQMPER